MDIISRFNRLAAMNSDTQNVDITTAYKLDEEVIKSLTKSIHDALNAKPKINIMIINP